MSFAQTSASQRQFLPPAVAVSTVAFALHPPADAKVQADYLPAVTSPEHSLSTPLQAGAVRFEPSSSTKSQTQCQSERKHNSANNDTVTLWIPLVRRTKTPFAGVWALPGGPIFWNEDLVATAHRTLHSAVHRSPAYIEQLYSFGARERSAQAQRLVTIAYWALYGEAEIAQDPSVFEAHQQHVSPGQRRWDDPQDTLAVALQSEPTESGLDPNVAWFSADNLPVLAFDHSEIVESALVRLRTKTEYSAVAHRFLGETFTLAQLREVHEAIRGSRTDPANFRRQMLSQGNLIDTGKTTTGTAYRPARLYQFASGFKHNRVTPS